MTRTPEHVEPQELFTHGGAQPEQPSHDQQEEAHVDLLVSNLDMDVKDIATFGVGGYRRMMDAMRGKDENGGYNAGLEITPTRALVASLATYNCVVPGIDGRPFTSAVHQSWAPGPLAIAGGKRTVTDVGAYVTMPETDRSIKTIRRISDKFGGVPAVVFPDKRDKFVLPLYTRSGLQFPAAQLAPEVYNDCANRGSLEDVYRTMSDNGVLGVVLDNHHLVRPAFLDKDYSLDPEKELDDLERLGIPLARHHVSAGREGDPDDQRTKHSQEELKAILDGPDAIARTQMGETLARGYDIWLGQAKASADRRAIVDSGNQPTGYREYRAYSFQDDLLRRWPNLPVTVEITFGGLVQALGYKPTRQQFADTHRVIAANVREFYNQAHRQAATSA